VGVCKQYIGAERRAKDGKNLRVGARVWVHVHNTSVQKETCKGRKEVAGGSQSVGACKQYIGAEGDVQRRESVCGWEPECGFM